MTAERKKCLGILRLQEGATEDEIKKAYRKLALQYHPDKNASEDAKGKFQEIGYAYKYLTEGPKAFDITNPNEFREDFLQRMFEEMFFAQFQNFTFCCDSSDEDDYYMYHDDSSDDNCYYSSHGASNVYGHTRREYQNTYPHQTNQQQSYPQVSKKQLRKREKRQRQKERAKERKEQGKKDKKETKNVYTDDVNSEQKEKEKKTESAPEDNSKKVFESNAEAGSSRPDTPVLNQQSQKSNKKQKKKMESEQRKREKEMEEIAAELRKKHEIQMEKQKQKERIAAQKKEEEKENQINFDHMFDNSKKSRKARQREKKRQEADTAAGHRDSSGSCVPPENKTHQSNTHTNSTTFNKKTEASINKPQEPKRTTKKQAMPRNRFDVLDDIDDNIIESLSRASLSSNDTAKNSYPYNKQYFYTSEETQRTATVKPAGPNMNSSNKVQQNNSGVNENRFTGKTRIFKNHTNMNQNNSNSYRYDNNSSPETNEIDNEGCAINGNKRNINQIGKSMHDRGKGRRNSYSLNSNTSSDIKNVLGEFDGMEDRQFVEDWGSSVYQSDEEDYVDDMTFSEGHSQSRSYQNGGHHGYVPNYTADNIRNGNTGWNQGRGGGMFQSQGYPNSRKEFIPRTRGYQGPRNNGPYYGGPQQWRPPFPRGSAPFTRGGDGWYPHRPPHFRGNYQGMPPFRGRNGGYPGPRYGPPFRMPAYGYGHPYDNPVPFGGWCNDREGYVNNDTKRNYYIHGNNRKNNNPKMPFKNNSRNVHEAMNEHTFNEFQPNVVKSSETASETTGSRVSSPQFMSWQNIKDSSRNGHISSNIFCDNDNNQAISSGSLDSLDDFEDYETNQAQSKENGTKAKCSTSGNRYSPDLGVDMGLSNYLSKDKLGVPSGMCSDSIKNYYK